MDTIILGLDLVMNGRSPLKLRMVYMNGWSCHLVFSIPCVADFSNVEGEMLMAAAWVGDAILLDKQGSDGRPRYGPAQQVLCRDFSRQGPSDG